MNTNDFTNYQSCAPIRISGGGRNQAKILADIISERDRQDNKWGEQNHDYSVWSTIIGEEYGEMCQAINDFRLNPTPDTEQDIYTEAIQTMATCMAMLECMERTRTSANNLK